jgi:hypothetical protein
MRVGDDQKVKRVHPLKAVAHPWHSVTTVTEHDHRLDVVALVHLLDV